MINGCSVYNGRDWGIHSINSDGITINNTVVSNCRRYGIFAESTDSLKINNNLVIGITE